MNDSELTDRAIAELMREIDAQNPSLANQTQCERKVNPLGKTNKRFLGRTINNALSHNKRAKERTVANCQQKLKDLDDRYEKRKLNKFYNRNRSTSRSRSKSTNRRASRSRSRCRSVDKRSSRTRSRSRSSPRRRSRKKSKKSRRKERKRSRSRSSSGSPYRSRSSRRKKQKRSSKKNKKTRRRSRSSLSTRRHSSYDPSFNETLPVPAPSELLLNHSKQMALVVAMAYSQVLNTKIPSNAQERASSPLSDIVKELMSDDDQTNNISLECLSISSNEAPKKVLTIDVSSNSEGNGDSESSDSESESSSCIELDNTSDSNNNSDIEIVECQTHEIKKPDNELNNKELSESVPSVDLTDD
ncbi:uncharacterized protein DDB_G0287625 [Drosophila ananassae]|nr:uncharacterized protein DDB_G0287625 [Drosophila ananassae]